MMKKFTSQEINEFISKPLFDEKTILNKDASYPKVTVVTPSYNQAEFIESTILSVLNQNYPNLEYIIIDGGSTDNSVNIISKYKDWLAYWISQPDKGQADAINRGFEKGTGDYFCWINSDDIIYPDFITERIKQFNDNPDIDFIYGDIDEGENIDSLVLRKGRAINSIDVIKNIDVEIPQQSAVWKKSVFIKAGMLDTELNVLLDRDFFTRVTLNCNILYEKGAVAFYRFHSESKSIKLTMQWAKELPEYYSGIFSNPYIPSHFRKYQNHVMANAHLYSAAILVGNEKSFSDVSKEVFKALGFKPFYILFRRFIFVFKLILTSMLGQKGRRRLRIMRKRVFGKK
jgi:glycosyltransferase involved in cell wall biosynthesis